MKIAVVELKSLIREALLEASGGGPSRGTYLKNAKKRRLARDAAAAKRKARKPAELPPSALQNYLIKVLSDNGFKLKSKGRNEGARKAWMDAREQGGAGFEGTAKQIQKLLQLPTTITTDQYETVVRGKNFDIRFMSPSEAEETGADVFIEVFAGKYAEEEKMGIDTGDFGHGYY